MLLLMMVLLLLLGTTKDWIEVMSPMSSMPLLVSPISIRIGDDDDDDDDDGDEVKLLDMGIARNHK